MLDVDTFEARCTSVERVSVECEELRRVLRGSYSLSPKSSCPAALHFGVVYILGDDGFQPIAVIHDVSRHALAYKLVGALQAHRIGSSVAREPLAFLSARVDGEIVEVLARGGFRIILSFHHPILSALKTAQRRGVTLVLRDKSNNLFVAVGRDVSDCNPVLEENLGLKVGLPIRRRGASVSAA